MTTTTTDDRLTIRQALLCNVVASGRTLEQARAVVAAYEADITHPLDWDAPAYLEPAIDTMRAVSLEIAEEMYPRQRAGVPPEFVTRSQWTRIESGVGA